MKKLLLGLMLVMLAGCGNHQVIDTVHTYNKAMIKLPNDEMIVVDVKSWADYEGEQIQIVDSVGTVYLTSSYNVVLIKE